MNDNVAVFVKSKTVFDELKKEAEKRDFTLHLNPDPEKYKEDHFVICDVENLVKEEGRGNTMSGGISNEKYSPVTV